MLVLPMRIAPAARRRATMMSSLACSVEYHGRYAYERIGDAWDFRPGEAASGFVPITQTNFESQCVARVSVLFTVLGLVV